jgi:regulator of protease activity HflC (stomatin/prohibitin superfamily)
MLQERTSSILARRTVNLFRSACRFGFIRRFYERHKVAIWISAATLLFLIVYLAPATVIFVGAGEAGVLYETFGRGTRTDVTYSEGAHVIWPWDRVTIYDVRINETTTRFPIISANGLDIVMTLSIRFHPRMKSLGLLHQQAGPDYAEKIIVPEIQAIVRNFSANYEPEEIYRTEPVLDQSIRAEASQRLEERFIALDAILIEQIELPASVQTAIQSKLVAKQAGEEMKFRIEKEAAEKQRKLIEAEGIRQFNSTIQASLSDEVLKYKGIEALLEMAKSAKSNTLFFGAPHSFRYLLDPGLDTATKGPAALGSAVAP